MTDKGLYIVVEGPEGAGKTTQIDLLVNRLRASGYAVRQFREPDSQTDVTARAIRQLTQDPRYPMSTRTEVLLYNAARSQSLQMIQEARSKGVVCVCDRNYLTTLAIQYYGRGDVPDYDTINSIIGFAVGGIEPDMTVVLDAPASQLHERQKSRGHGERFDNLSIEFLDRVRAGYLLEAKQRNLPIIDATQSPQEVHEAIWKLLTTTRPVSKPAEFSAPPVQSVTQASQSSGDLLAKNENGNLIITKAGKEYLEQIVTNTEGDVYAFTDKLSATTVAAAMARLSRRADDMRITILDEFTGKEGKDDDLLRRVITAYGDDSVQQLVGLHYVVEGASNLLTKKLEWGRLAAYLEQSTRYIFFDQKDDEGKFKYYIPTTLNKKTTAEYIKVMDEIFELYSVMVRKTTEHVRAHSSVPKNEQDGAWLAATRAQACDAIRPVLPVATKSTVGIYASGQALESMIMRLLADEQQEARDTGKRILHEARKVTPTFLERADNPERGGATTAYIANNRDNTKKIAEKYLPASHANQTEPVTLTDVWPRNELDIVADILYEHSDLSLSDIRSEVATWTYKKKSETLKAFIGERLNRRHRPGRALEKVHYSWDLICDYGIFRDLQRHRMVDDLNWQALTPRYGYEIPELVEQAGVVEEFITCFDKSLELYSTLQAAGHELEAQYATLLGHRMRWKVTYNAREAFHLHELRTTPHGHPGYRKLVMSMHEKVTEVHPLLAEAMKFVNKEEDPELTRLAAERATQYKLQKLEK